METTKIEVSQPEKLFDAVAMMREIRDHISSETENMTFEQLKAYMNEKLSHEDVRVIGKT